MMATGFFERWRFSEMSDKSPPHHCRLAQVSVPARQRLERVVAFEDVIFGAGDALPGVWVTKLAQRLISFANREWPCVSNNGIVNCQPQCARLCILALSQLNQAAEVQVFIVPSTAIASHERTERLFSQGLQEVSKSQRLESINHIDSTTYSHHT